MDDCELLKDQLTLKDTIKDIADKTECIKFIYLTVAKTTWDNSDGRSLDKKTVTFENLLETHRKRELFVTLTARVVAKTHNDFQTQFRLDSRNCPEERNGNSPTERKPNIAISTLSPNVTENDLIVTNSPTDEKEIVTISLHAEENGSNETISPIDIENASDDESEIPIIASVAATVILVVIIVGVICWTTTRKKKRKGKKSSTGENTEENHIYGTYSRGWYEEGEYGDGDKVYVTDTNDYYYAA